MAVTYRWAGAAVLRATTEPNPADRPETFDLNDACATRTWLAQLFARPDVRNALFAASPVLTRTVESIVHGRQTQPRHIRRAALSVTSYLLRWRHRPTPFALFAGVADVKVGATARHQERECSGPRYQRCHPYRTSNPQSPTRTPEPPVASVLSPTPTTPKGT
ncbi:lantibiotic dehydratase [Streptomyces sp. NBC_00120]|uniref:Lantibiotic dehydratase family protein n=1 Tax=Streptomyces sp. NBC_00119 TaxID=2975659 RepID=A0AAU1UMB8_9ACTN|nr:lantibiotic dehydratase [Streptomyces sp. NBC_00120]MCX5321577.1 lantibiotic dehydratase family protein [Streptomyces sp. NBC_00120]